MSFHNKGIKICIAFLLATTGFGAAYAIPTDADGDGVFDTADNCINVANPGQEDTDADGHGNICDGDVTGPGGPAAQDCLVNFLDVNLMTGSFFSASPPASPDLDLAGPTGSPDGFINFLDLNVMIGGFFGPPGPSAPGALCNPDADNDGVADADDLCPGTPAGSVVDEDGCVVVPQLIQVVSATASSTFGGNGPGLAVDGIDNDPPPGTRWESEHGAGSGSITLNLGTSYALSEVIIDWEAANAASYDIRGCEDVNCSSWTMLSSETGGAFGNRTDTIPVSGVYQYVQMYAHTRSVGNNWGYSIWEMEVYGWPAADEDNDGVDDSQDLCPGTPPGSTVDADGCVPVDTDGDGVVDGQDLCPNTPPGSTVDANGCAIIDTDNDGVVDGLDQCPNTPPGDIVDSTGCTVVLDGIEVTSANNVLVGGGDSAQPNFTLYVFDDDLAAPGTSTCTGGCATAWPPLLVTDGLPSGVWDLGSIARTEGDQVTHDGRPLYFYTGDNFAGDTFGDGVNGKWHTVAFASVDAIDPLYDASTTLEPVTSYVRGDGVVVTRFGDRGRDRHAKDIGIYDANNPIHSDHYDHYLAEYWHYRTARIQIEDHVPNGQSLIKFTYITESRLGAKEFRAWYKGLNTTGEFHFNVGATEMGCGTFDDNFELVIGVPGIQCKYVVEVIEQWKDVGPFDPLQLGVNMEFEISQFLLNPPSGLRLNYYGTSYVYVIGTPGLAPFEWQRGVINPNQTNDGTAIPAVGLLGGDTTLGYNYSEEPAGRFMQMATNLSHSNVQPFVRGRRVHHTNFEDGKHDERDENPVWNEQIGKAGNHYINLACANCHVRNGRALVADVGDDLDKWVFKVGEVNAVDGSTDPDPLMGNVLQPNQIGTGTGEGTVSLGAWTNLPNGLRAPNYVFSNGTPARFSARIAPQLVGMGLLDAVEESTILAWADPDDVNADGISGRAALVLDPESGDTRLGRFGYKAATSSVRHQVAAALNTDIGVMTSVQPAPDCGSAQTNCGATGQPLADDQLDDLVKYINLLGVGARRDYADTAGETLFTNIGCASCHRPTLTTSDHHPLAELRSQTIHPYTDLLLHDMGPDLADNHGEGVATGAEWRTAPLWGLGHAESVMLGDAKANDSVTQPIDPNDVNRIGYLHDGRARTIDEAIRWHGGEGEPAKAAYEGLTQTDKDALLDFLESL